MGLFLKLFYPVRKRIIVNTKTGKAFQGILWKNGSRILELKNAEILKNGGGSVQVDGSVIIYRADVDFIQVIG